MFDCLHFSKFAKWREYAMSHLWEVSKFAPSSCPVLIRFIGDKKKKKNNRIPLRSAQIIYKTTVTCLAKKKKPNVKTRNIKQQ